MLLAFLLSSVPLCSQGIGTTTGTLAGEASDENNGSMPGVLISVSSSEGTKTATTDTAGRYIFPYLSPGTYTVRAELQGFSTIEKNDVRIGLGQRVEISFRMKPAVHENVIV